MAASAPSLVLAVHGTRSVRGQATIDRLVTAVRVARPGADVRLCFLDVLAPSLLSVAEHVTSGVVVPALLSTGFHIRQDVPAVVSRTGLVPARHLGPHELLADAVADRLAEAGGPGASVVLVATGSTDPLAWEETVEAASLLSRRIGREVRAASSAEEIGPLLGPGISVARYLLAEGTFATRIGEAAQQAGSPIVSEPIGAHPSVVELIWQRYDEADGG